MKNRIVIILLLSFLLPTPLAFAIDDAPKYPACSCFRDVEGEGLWGPLAEPCPKNQYSVGLDDSSRGERYDNYPPSAPVWSCCCPLLYDDVLTDSHVYAVVDACPDGYVVTGGSDAGCIKNCMMRCTKINLEKYSLGPKRQGLYWKRKGFFMYGGWGSAQQMLWEDIPRSIRFGHGRLSGYFDGDGCAADPPGAFLVEKNGYFCNQYFYRELRTKDGQPVKMFPECPDTLDSSDMYPMCRR